MSEPLYRIWDINNQYYITNKDFFVNLNGNISHVRSYQKDEYYIIQRCTGEKDVNGKYIYEGDIVLNKTNSNYTVQTTILYAWGNFIMKSLYTDDAFDSNLKLEIIGNNLENPELLLEKEE